MIELSVAKGKARERRYRYTKPVVRVAADKGADLVIPELEEAQFDLQANDQGVTLVLRSGPAGLTHNGAPAAAEQTLQPGDELAVNGIRIVLVRLPVAGAAASDGKPQAKPSESKSDASSSGSPVADDGEKEMLSKTEYLYLFLHPIRAYLEDDEVSEVLINGPQHIYIERKGRLSRCEEVFQSERALQAAIKNVARSMGRVFDDRNPRLDARLPDGSRVHAVMPPMSRQGTVVAIRKFMRDTLSIADLLRYGSVTEEAVDLIRTIVALHKNVIISGGTSSGKTSVLNVLSSMIADDERILVMEDASELQLQQEHVVYFETRQVDEKGKNAVSIRDLIHSSLRLRPDRIVIGEIRGGEALDLLQALNTGHGGSMSTIHANTPLDALSRLETCAMLSGVEFPLVALRQQVASAIDVIVQTARLSDKSRKITHVSEVLPLQDGQYAARDLLRYRVRKIEADGTLQGRLEGTGETPTFLEEARARGMTIKDEWFKAAE